MEEGRGEGKFDIWNCYVRNQNELETLLEQAATEPAHRPAFFRTLLESTVWVPGTAAEGEQVVEDSALDLLHWEKDDGTSVIPFFTSLEALQEAVEDEQTFVVMPVRTLFEMTRADAVPQRQTTDRERVYSARNQPSDW